MKTPRPSAVVLILANLVPLGGVIWFDWQVIDILLLYWAENVVIGVVNVLRMLTSRPSLGILQMAEGRSGLQFTATQRARLSAVASRSRFFLIPFFTIHYGAFCWGHYTAVVSLFGEELRQSGGGLYGDFLADAWHSPLWLGVAAIAISHLLSFYYNFIGSGEYLRTSLVQLMKRPYGRIIVLHVTIIAGGFLVTTLGHPVWMLLALVVVKTVIDLRMHERERNVFGPAETVS